MSVSPRISLLGVFNAFLGGDATFAQVFAVVTHAGLVRALAAAAGKPGLRLTNLGACWFTVHGDGRVSVSDPVHLID